MNQTMVQVRAWFDDGHDELFLVFVPEHSDWTVTNADAIYIVRRKLRGLDVRAMEAITCL